MKDNRDLYVTLPPFANISILPDKPMDCSIDLQYSDEDLTLEGYVSGPDSDSDYDDIHDLSLDCHINFRQTEAGRKILHIKTSFLGLQTIDDCIDHIEMLKRRVAKLREFAKHLDTKIRMILNSSPNISHDSKMAVADYGRMIFDNMLMQCAFEREMLLVSEKLDGKLTDLEWTNKENVWISKFNKEYAEYQNLVLWLRIDKENNWRNS